MVVSCKEEQELVYGIKICSVGPGKMSGHNMVHELTNMDLAMKLHNLRAVYFFSSEAELTVMKVKETTFTLFNYYFIPCGRLRMSDSGRPNIKCNDCGVRFVEAQCSKSIEEWLDMKDDANYNPDMLLVPHNVIGPELPYSPPVFIQVTSFKCGGISLGLGWSHVLGDAFSASDFMNSWGQVMTGLAHQVTIPHRSEKHENYSFLKKINSAKRIDNVGDHWTITNNTQMVTFSLKLTSSQLTTLKSKIIGHNQTDMEIPSFESLCAVIWQCIAKVKEGGQEPKTVTLCKKNEKRIVGELSNYGQIICSVKACFTIQDASIKDLAILLMDSNAVDETSKIEEALEEEQIQGGMDFIIYGANLTFIDMEEADLYGFVFHGHKPIFVDYNVEGVGDEGMIVVLPESSDSGKSQGGGRVINITLPETQALKVKSELQRELSVL